MNTVQQEIATPKACNKSLVFNAAIAAIITAGAALTVFVYTFSPVAAIFMPLPALIGLGFIVRQLVKAKEYKTFPALIFYAVLTSVLGAITALAPSNYTVLLTLAVLALVSVYAILLMKKDREITAAIVFCMIMCFAVILCLAFRNIKRDKLEFTLWRGNVISLTFKEAVIGLWAAALISIAAIFLCYYLFHLAGQKRKVTTRYITYTAMFAALSVLFKILGNSITGSLAFISPNLKLTIVYIPWVLAGVVLGPAGGMAAAGIGDFIGQMLLPAGGAWFWMTWLSNVLFPLFPALAMIFLPLGKKYDWLKILIGTAVSTLVCTLGLGTLAISILKGTKYPAELVLRWPQPIIIGINYFLILSLLPVLERLKITRLKFFEPREIEAG